MPIKAPITTKCIMPKRDAIAPRFCFGRGDANAREQRGRALAMPSA